MSSETTNPAHEDSKRSGCAYTFVARLTPDAAQLLWVRHVRGGSDAPAISLDATGRILFLGPDYRLLDANGKQLSAIPIPVGAGGFIAVNPVDGTIARGGEHHWCTGRERWHCPTLHIHKGDDKNIALMFDGRCTVKAAGLGLKKLPAGALIEIRFGLTASPPQATGAAPKKAKP